MGNVGGELVHKISVNWTRLNGYYHQAMVAYKSCSTSHVILMNSASFG